MAGSRSDANNINAQVDQREVIAFLSDPASFGVASVDRFETHANLVFLARAEAWKIKRAVRLAYLDFSSREARKRACAREVEVNRRYAPQLYLGVATITRSLDGHLAIDGDGEAIEWAVHMRRFEQSALLSTIAASGGIGPALADALAETVYQSHREAPRAPAQSGSAPVRQLAHSIITAIGQSDVFLKRDVAALATAIERELRRAEETLENRARVGCVRRCHGDLHLANIVLLDGRPVLYDAVEFDEALATIDTLYDLAFLLMDLDYRGHRQAANLVLNRYCWRARDCSMLSGLTALPLFLGIRAAVRALVNADRAQQTHQAATPLRAEATRYLRKAIEDLSPPRPELVAIGGLSGSGKSTLGMAIAPKLGPSPGAIHLRSDVERKALFGVEPTTRLAADAYTPAINRSVYANLERKSFAVLGAGHSVVVDAVFARPDERRAIEQLARQSGVSFRGLWLRADPDTLFARVGARRNDASDAAAEVVREQLALDLGGLSPAWASVETGGSIDETVQKAYAVLATFPMRA
jgi:aminoglycoside phosphotransferase family enzyme/predicted kinase